MSYTSVMNLKRKLMKEFEKETGLTPDYREDWKAWLGENECIEPEPNETSKEDFKDPNAKTIYVEEKAVETEPVYMKFKLT